MQRTLKELVLKNGDYVYDGDLTIDGKVLISNGSLRVSGKLFLKGLSETGNSPRLLLTVILWQIPLPAEHLGFVAGVIL